MVVVTLAEPAIIDHEPLHTHLRGAFGERDLRVGREVHLRRLPGVVDDWTRLGLARFTAFGQDLLQLKLAQDARRLAIAAIRVTRVELRCLERRAGCKRPMKVEWVVAAGHPRLAQRSIFGDDLPAPAPAKLPKPDRTGLFGRFPLFADRKPRVGLVRRVSGTAFLHALSGL